MKLLIVLLSLSSFSWAGTPDQDLIVDIMRERFKESSKVVTEYDLALDQNWLCVYYNARMGIIPNYTSYKNLFQFHREDDGSYSNKANFEVNQFRLDNDGNFIGIRSDDRLYGRKAKEDTLIFEHVAHQYRTNKSYPSVSNHNLAGHGYIYCKLQK